MNWNLEGVDTIAVLEPTPATGHTMKLSLMQEAFWAFRVLGILVCCNGRRYDRLMEYRNAKWLPVETGSPMLTVSMAPRSLRRELQGKGFRPVYGYRGPEAKDHKDTIAALKSSPKAFKRTR